MKLSIVTPSFQQASYIPRTLDSVLVRQDVTDVEYIVVDGGSTDRTLEILKSYAAKFPNMRFIYEKDNGQSDAINKGFKQASGDIIGWINSDDFYEDNIFQFVIDFFNKNSDVDMLYGGCNFVDTMGTVIGLYENDYGYKKCVPSNYKTFNYNILLNVYSGLIPQPSVFLRKSVFTKVGYLDESYHFTMDYEYWLRIGKTCTIVCVDKVLANFRSHVEAKTNFKNGFKFFAEIERARRAHGGSFCWKFYTYNYWVLLKTVCKLILMKAGLKR